MLAIAASLPTASTPAGARVVVVESRGMPNGWTPVPIRRPYRVMAVACATTNWFAASEEEKEQRFFPRFKQVLAEWEELGARVVASFCDDVLQVGPTREPWAWNLIYEVDDLDVAAAMVQAVREVVDGVRLDTYVQLEVRIGRPFFAREEG
jgi:hypothetical protein